MKISIRNVPEDVNLKLKEKAKKANMSMNAYVLNLLATHVLAEEIEGVKMDYEEILKSTLAIIEDNTKVIQRFIEINEGG